MENKALKRYLSQLRRALTCSRTDRERLLAQGRQLVEDFLEENPRASYVELAAAFGQPKDFASEMLSQLDPGEVEKARKQQKCLRQGLAAIILLTLLFTSVFWYARWAKDQEIISGDFRIVFGPVEQLTDEEYEEKCGVNPADLVKK